MFTAFPFPMRSQLTLNGLRPTCILYAAEGIFNGRHFHPPRNQSILTSQQPECRGLTQAFPVPRDHERLALELACPPWLVSRPKALSVL